MKITVSDARALAAALATGADQAEQAGQTEFDLDASLSEQAQSALDAFQKVIDATPGA